MIIHRRKTGPVSKSDDRLTLMLLFYIAAGCGKYWYTGAQVDLVVR